MHLKELIVKKNIDKSLFKRKVGFARRKRNFRRSVQGVPKRVIGELHRERYNEFFDYIKVKAPTNFSFIDNTLEFISFLNEIDRLYEQRKKVFVKMNHITSMADDAILVLLSSMIKYRANNRLFNGNKPRRKDLLKRLIDSGFFQQLYSKPSLENDYSINTIKSKIYTHAQKTVDAPLAHQLIGQASKVVWGEKRRCPGIQNTLKELMQNTHNHASENKGEKLWWTVISKDWDEKKVRFSFIDYGLGVFRSLNDKKPTEKFYKALEKLKIKFPWAQSEAEQLELILKGELHRTSTGQNNRGKGLPAIYKSLIDGRLDSLVIITNGVYADVKNSDFHMLDNEFHGTFISWEMNKDIFNLVWNN